MSGAMIRQVMRSPPRVGAVLLTGTGIGPAAAGPSPVMPDETRDARQRWVVRKHSGSVVLGQDRAVSEKRPPQRLPRMRVVPIKTGRRGNLQ